MTIVACLVISSRSPLVRPTPLIFITILGSPEALMKRDRGSLTSGRRRDGRSPGVARRRRKDASGDTPRLLTPTMSLRTPSSGTREGVYYQN